MIFVTIGNGWQFDRLLLCVDKALEQLNYSGEIVYQIGPSNYKPRFGKYYKLLDKKFYRDCLTNADFVISHAGEGIVMESISLLKKPMVMPRLEKYDEAKNDHQLDLVNKFSDMNLITHIESDYNIIEVIKRNDNKIMIEDLSKFPNFLGDAIGDIIGKI